MTIVSGSRVEARAPDDPLIEAMLREIKMERDRAKFSERLKSELGL